MMLHWLSPDCAHVEETQNYDRNHTFQAVWVAKPPWAQVVIGLNGKILQVQCLVSTRIEGKREVVGP